jgi:DNA-binding HxlR family transcriptional regulator
MAHKNTACCGVARFLTILDGPWATLIVRELLHGPLRFTQLREALPGISAHTLTHRLKGFERHGLVTRTAYAETPPRVVYELTPLGEGLRGVLEAMATWGDALPPEIAGAHDAVAGASVEPEKEPLAMLPSCPFSQSAPPVVD